MLNIFKSKKPEKTFKPLLPEKDNTPVQGFLAHDIHVQFRGDSDILQFLIAAGKDYLSSCQNKDPDQNTPVLKELSKQIEGGFYASLVKESDIQPILACIESLGISNEGIYILSTEYIARPEPNGSLSYHLTGVFKQGDFRPSVLIWNTANQSWLKTMLKNNNIEEIKTGTGWIEQVKQEAAPEKKGPSVPENLPPDEIERYKVSTALLEIIEYCLDQDMEGPDQPEPGKPSVRQKLRDYDEDNSSESKFGYS